MAPVDKVKPGSTTTTGLDLLKVSNHLFLSQTGSLQGERGGSKHVRQVGLQAVDSRERDTGTRGAANKLTSR